MNSPENSRLLYSYYRTERSNGVVPSYALSAYAHSMIFDFENKNIWHKGLPFGNTFWGSYHGETFNDFEHNTAYGDFSHAEGQQTTASGNNAHAQGYSTIASGEDSFATGNTTTASGKASVAEGENTIATGENSHTEGFETLASNINSHAEGYTTYTLGENSHSEGVFTSTYGNGSHVEGRETVAYANNSHVEGYQSYTGVNGLYSHAEGKNTYTWGIASHTEGENTYTKGIASHAEGKSTLATVDYSHAEGYNTNAKGVYSHVEGNNTETNEEGAHAEGALTTASGMYSHTEGFESSTDALASYSHAEGYHTSANGLASHTEGKNTIALNSYEHASGEFNQSVSSETDAYQGTVFTIGNGTDAKHRHNIVEFHKDGSMMRNGSSYFNDDIYGPVSYTYVESLGPTANLDIILSSLLDQPKYTKPQLYYSISVPSTTYSGTSTSMSGNIQSSRVDTIEVGRPYSEDIKFSWIEKDTNTSGTLMKPAYHSQDPSVIPGNYVLGYSYGVNKAIEFYFRNYDAVKPEGYPDFTTYVNVTSYNATTGDVTYHPCSIDHSGDYDNQYLFDTVGSYVTFNGAKMPYLHSSYMYFQQLYNKNVYVIAHGNGDTAWFRDGIFNLNVSHTINVRNKYYWGFIGDSYDPESGWKPTDKTTVLNGTAGFGWINPTGTTTISINLASYKAKALEQKYSFFLAIPYTHKLSTYEGHQIHVLQPDGVSFDMVTADQKLQENDLKKFALGRAEVITTYKLYYVNFQHSIGNVNDIIYINIVNN